MIMNLIVIVLVLSIAYAWMIRGVFNAMIHMLCTIAAGAIAFAVWEKLALMLINASPERGFFSFLESIAWGVALLVPFAVSLVVLRLITDKVIPNNIKNSTPINYAGGAVCGLVSGVIATGMLVIGVGNMRVSSDFLGYQPLWYNADRTTGAGALVKSESLWVPVDSIVSRAYATLSKGSMSSNEPLAKWYPHLELTGLASRISPGEGAARNAVRPKDFTIKSVYTVGDPAGSTPINTLLKNSDGSVQKYVDIDEKPVATGMIYGYVLAFEPGAKERGKKGGGQLVVSNGQLRLLVGDGDGHTQTVFPVATISESSQPGRFGRWRFDAPDVYITSTGGQSRITMGFEFVVPQGYQPLAMYVKNVRVALDNLPKPVAFATTAQRDLRIPTGSILEGAKGTPQAREFNTASSVVINPTDRSGPASINTRLMDVISTTSAKRGMTINDDNEIVDGDGTFDVKLEVGRRNTPNSRQLRCERYALGEGQAMVKVIVGAGSPIGFLSDAAREAPLDAPMSLIDENGNEYEAIGFEYKDRDIMRLRYTRGSTLTGIQDTPSLSTTRDDQELRLIFIITKGVKIDRFVIGNTQIASFSPPIE